MTTVAPSPTRSLGLAFSHVGLYVADLARMEDFYARVLGFTVTDRGQLPTPAGLVDLVFLSRDPGEHHQIVLASGRPEHLPFNVVNQLSFRVPDLATLRQFHDVLQAEAVDEMRPVTHGNAISLYFRDPEGNRLEVFMDTPWYCTQPCRVPLDFSMSDQQILDWTESLVRQLPGFTSHGEWMETIRHKIDAA
jgi:catechol 2,3-dioxygenase